MVERPSALSTVIQRMSEQARGALYFARQEVSEYGSAAVEPEHLLLGVIHEGQGLAAILLRDVFHLERAVLIDEVASQIERKPKFSTAIEVPFGASTKEILVATVEEADRLSHREIRPEHLLLGILRVADTIPATILSAHDVILDSAREAVAARAVNGRNAPFRFADRYD
jgi:ATP-dependent Clp protease ATP-binding subunit ClpC